MSAIEKDEFDAMHLNVIRLTRVSDCEIALAEIKFKIDQINSDIAARLGNAAWESSAVAAREWFEHKARMLVMKRESLIAEAKERESRIEEKKPKHSEEVVKAIRFKKAARVILDEPTFQKVKAMADLNGNGADE